MNILKAPGSSKAAAVLLVLFYALQVTVVYGNFKKLFYTLRFIDKKTNSRENLRSIPLWDDKEIHLNRHPTLKGHMIISTPTGKNITIYTKNLKPGSVAVSTKNSLPHIYATQEGVIVSGTLIDNNPAKNFLQRAVQSMRVRYTALGSGVLTAMALAALLSPSGPGLAMLALKNPAVQAMAFSMIQTSIIQYISSRATKNSAIQNKALDYLKKPDGKIEALDAFKDPEVQKMAYDVSLDPAIHEAVEKLKSKDPNAEGLDILKNPEITNMINEIVQNPTMQHLFYEALKNPSVQHLAYETVKSPELQQFAMDSVKTVMGSASDNAMSVANMAAGNVKTLAKTLSTQWSQQSGDKS